MVCQRAFCRSMSLKCTLFFDKTGSLALKPVFSYRCRRLKRKVFMQLKRQPSSLIVLRNLNDLSGMQRAICCLAKLVTFGVSHLGCCPRLDSIGEHVSPLLGHCRSPGWDVPGRHHQLRQEFVCGRPRGRAGQQLPPIGCSLLLKWF